MYICVYVIYVWIGIYELERGIKRVIFIVIVIVYDIVNYLYNSFS